jgi:Ca2+-transporting ATPase
VTAAAGAERPTWHLRGVVEVEQALGTSDVGLPSAIAEARRREAGPNAIPEPRRPGPWRILLDQLASPLIYILIAAALVSVAMGELVDAAVMAVVLILNTAIGFLQEHRAENAVRALLRMAAPRARVIRDAREVELAASELVVGDLVLVDSGTRVPADLRLATATALQVDESLLTGESVAVEKNPRAVEAGAPLADRTNLLYAGTVVRSGRGRGYVIATGARTELGAIALEVGAEPRATPPLQRRLGRLGRVIAATVVITSCLAFIIGIAQGQRIGQMFLVTVALAVSAVPEGLPIASTIALALGVRRMAGRRAIVRRLAAVEALGSTSVICTDKTGTLTMNRMTVEAIWAGGVLYAMPSAAVGGVPADAGLATSGLAERNAAVRLTLLTGVLSNESEVYETPGGWESHGDATEAAMLIAALELGMVPEALRTRHVLEAESPFEPERRYSASVRRADGRRWLFVKGAPERVVPACTVAQSGDGTSALDHREIQEATRRMASVGLRVLAMACRELAPGEDAESAVATLGDLTLAGLEGMADPPRPGVPEAIRACHGAGIRVVMITGDHRDTSQAIARAVGLLDDGAVVTGQEIDAMEPGELDAAVTRTTVFARTTPEHKLAIVRAFQRQGDVVAVTGDGVNDGPALKAADTGVAMGRTGTDLAREAADIVLTDDDFVSLADAVAEGRITFDNIRNTTFFLLSTNAAEVAVVLVAMAARWPLPLLATQLLWLNLVTEGVQQFALAFEPGAADVLARHPRPRREGILSGRLWERVAVAGAVQAAGTLLLFAWAYRSVSLPEAQAVALASLVAFQTFQIGNSRSMTRSALAVSPLRNPLLLVSAAAAFALNLVVLHTGAGRLLGLGPMNVRDWPLILLVASSVIVAMELHKRFRPAIAT